MQKSNPTLYDDGKHFSWNLSFCVTFYMQVAGVALIKRAPFIRLLVPMVMGIIIQWHFRLPVPVLYVALFAAVAYLLLNFWLPLVKKFSLGWVTGLAISIALTTSGALMTYQHDIRNNDLWIGHHYTENQRLVVSLDEELVTKKKSYKADARVRYLISNDTVIPVAGKIIIYFQKDEEIAALSYGTTLVVRRPLQAIQNAGNPGSFDYKRYCLFNDITHQVFLKQDDFVVLPTKQTNWFRNFLIHSRKEVVSVLKKHINGAKETGLAEALLIGYKNDLDKNLVQAYTNTGVVHIIAISGLHLGMVYLILVFIMKPLKQKKYTRWLFAVVVISCLWLFSLMAGGQPSVLRAALMFSCIVIGEAISRRTSVYNTLAFSAFLLLCINPFYLWDVGFQLSYAAVLSIVIFMKPINDLIYIKNKTLEFIWKLNSVTLAAQVLTIPVSVYHFHQFPNLFLLSNLVAVPLSGLILYGLILLCAVAMIPFLAALGGLIISKLIAVLNNYIEYINHLPYAVWDGLQVSIWQTLMLFIVIAAGAHWLLLKNKKGLMAALLALFLFYSLNTIAYLQADNQQKLIVYNVPGKHAIDFIQGRQAYFTGHPDMLQDEFLNNFHLKPSRTLHHVESIFNDTTAKLANRYFLYGKLKMGIISYPPPAGVEVQQVDLAIISGNKIKDINKVIDHLAANQLVFDGSVPAYLYNRWNKTLEQKKIPHHYVVEKGAFVFNPK